MERSPITKLISFQAKWHLQTTCLDSFPFNNLFRLRQSHFTTKSFQLLLTHKIKINENKKRKFLSTAKSTLIFLMISCKDLEKRKENEEEKTLIEEMFLNFYLVCFIKCCFSRVNTIKFLKNVYLIYCYYFKLGGVTE